MNKNLFLIFVFFFLSFTCKEGRNGETPYGKYHNPVIRADAPDPTVILAQDGFYYLYHTGIGIYRSKDLVEWTNLGKAFTDEGRPQWEPKAGLWAPDINYIDGQYVMYYSMSVWDGIETCGIGRAVSKKPEGPFIDLGLLFRSNEIGVLNSIDPCLFEENGRKYLFWGSFHGIFGVELTGDGLYLKPNTEKRQVAGTAYEGTCIHRKGKYYYLFASTGSCCEGLKSTYTTVAGRSENLWGPYLNRAGESMMNNAHEVVVHGSDHFKGTGHNAEIVTDNSGNDWLLYHAYQTEHPELKRQALLDKIIWDNDWPVVKNRIPSDEHTVPDLK